MPGTLDDWTQVTSTELAGAPDTPPTPDSPSTSTRTSARRRRRWPLVAAATAVALVAGGAVAYASARKTVTLDVDGTTTTVTTFAGSVAGLLDEAGVRVGDRDVVAPAGDSALRNGADVVVRYGRELTVQADGAQSDVWLAALDADDALSQLSGRGSDVRLVASRSGERAELPLRLDANGPVTLLVDGASRVVDGGAQVDDVLDAAGVTLGADDRVSIVRDASSDPAVTLQVQRVVTQDVPTETPVDFQTVTQQDANRFTDQGDAVTQEGVPGVHTRVDRVTTVDGVEESRSLVSEGVTTPPVDKIVVQGTKERPKPAPKPAAAPKAAASSGSSGSAAAAPAPAAVVGGDVWARLAQCESGGNPATNTGNGYYGLYQFSATTWRAMGGSGLPSEASAAEQTQRAQALQARSGWGQWPGCARKLGLL